MSTPDETKPWFINCGGTLQIVTLDDTDSWYPPIFHSRKRGLLRVDINRNMMIKYGIWGISPIFRQTKILEWNMTDIFGTDVLSLYDEDI